MKKFVSIVMACILMAGCIMGCGAVNSPVADENNEGGFDKKGPSIVVTIFPEYDWVMNILGENPANADVTMLLDKGVDLHSFQPSAEDIMNISKCDLFIYVGGESDEWVEDALKEAVNKDMKVVSLMDVLASSVKEEEVVEGMQGEEEEEEAEGEEEEIEYDEHVWLSLKNAKVAIDSIASALCEIDPANESTYKDNASKYGKALDDLDNDYNEVVKNAQLNTVLFGDRFPFRYLTDDYNLNYYAAFVGCSAETEASFETVTFLAGKVDELGIKSVLTIEKSDQKLAETIIENTASKDADILTMDSMQSVTAEDVNNGANYLSIMEENLNVLEAALQ